MPFACNLPTSTRQGYTCNRAGNPVPKLRVMSDLTTMKAQAQTFQQAALPHVLAVDDDPVIRELISDYLQQNEFRVTAVADGRAMQSVLAEEVVDLVVLDLKLQAEDGMLLARKLRDESMIPIIMLTGRRRGGRPGDGTRARRGRLPHQALQPARAARPHPHRAAPPPRRGAPGSARRHPGLPLRRLGAQPEHAAPHGARRARGRCSATASSACSSSCSAPRSASSRATSSWTCPACTTTRSTTARSTCRSCGCAGRSSRIRGNRATSSPSGARATCSASRSKPFTDPVPAAGDITARPCGSARREPARLRRRPRTPRRRAESRHGASAAGCRSRPRSST